jgi:CubicO group peptidase (beta-lactamase class C family)
MHNVGTILFVGLSLTCAGWTLAAQVAPNENAALVARARALEIQTPYVPPPGDPLEHHAAGFAKIMCSAVFITGLGEDFAAEHVGYFVAPYDVRAKLGRPTIDPAGRAVHVKLPNDVVRTARHVGSQGCVTVPIGRSSLAFTPVDVKSGLPDAGTQEWPMGDRVPDTPLPAGVDAARLQQAVDAAFDPAEAMTAAFVVTWKGRIVAERYGEGITRQTPLEAWSMGKSIVATLLGILVGQGLYDLWQPAPVPEWQTPGDPRAAIRIADLLRMSSGLRIRAPLDPEFDPGGPYPDHVYLYTGSADSAQYAATRPLQWPPNTVGRYRNTDPVVLTYLLRLALEKRREEYLLFPQQALFDKLGIRTMVLETDAFGNLMLHGYVLGAARDFARLGNLYLQDGVWNGERILPEGYASFVSTVAPAWAADGRPVYGAMFWINGDGALPIPTTAYRMAGAGGQSVHVIPSHDLVVVRMGHYKGEAPAAASLRRALALLMEAIPEAKQSR